MMSRILVASVAAEKRLELRAALEFQGHDVSEAATADEIVQEACCGMYDVLVLDSSSGGVGPCDVCRAVRPKSDLGIIVLNSNGSAQARIDALNAGADDCVPARYVLAELLARVRALLRRVTSSREQERQVLLHDRAIDLKSHKVKGPLDRVAHLTPKECLVLQCLIAHANKPLAHQSFARAVWQRDGRGNVEYLRVVIQQLRRKLEVHPARPRYILTERSFGYRFQLQLSDLERGGPPSFVSSLPYPPSADRSDTPATVQ